MTIDPSIVQKAEIVAARFFPDEKAWQVKKIGSGHIHHTLLLRAASGAAYLLQNINTQVFKQPTVLMDNITKVTSHLQQSKYPLKVASPLTDPQGDFLVSEGEQYWRAFPFLATTQTYDQVEKTEQAYRAAKAFGHFSYYLADLPSEKLRANIPDFHNCQFRQQQFVNAIREDRAGHLAAVKKDVDFLMENTFCSAWQKLKFPSRISHNDTKINNILFDAEGLHPVAIIDLDTAMPGSPLYDFGDMVRTFTNAALEDEAAEKATLRLPFFEALCEGFSESINPLLLPVEREALLLASFLVTHVQAQRFLSDYLQGNIYYKVQYPEHNLIRARNQITLLRSMLHQEKEMKLILNKKFIGQ